MQFRTHGESQLFSQHSPPLREAGFKRVAVISAHQYSLNEEIFHRPPKCVRWVSQRNFDLSQVSGFTRASYVIDDPHPQHRKRGLTDPPDDLHGSVLVPAIEHREAKVEVAKGSFKAIWSLRFMRQPNLPGVSVAVHNCPPARDELSEST